MDNLLEITGGLPPYQPAIIALLVLCLITMIQALMTAPLAFLPGKQTPGKPLDGGPQDISFRAVRTHANSVENLPTIGFGIIIAIAVNADPTLINWAASIHVISRLGYWIVYYAGIGGFPFGPRTLFFGGGAISNLVLLVAVLVHMV